jgi:hypothetical protein
MCRCTLHGTIGFSYGFTHLAITRLRLQRKGEYGTVELGLQLGGAAVRMLCHFPVALTLGTASEQCVPGTTMPCAWLHFVSKRAFGVVLYGWS